MRYLAALLFLMFGAGAADACSCFGAGGRQQAEGIAANAVAVVMVERINPDDNWREGMLLRPVHLYMGARQESFRIRPRFGSSSCDGYVPVDRPSLQVIYPHAGPVPEEQEEIGDISTAPTHPGPFYELGDVCTNIFLSQEPDALELVLEEARKLGKPVYPR